MSSRKVLIFVNPQSGKGKSRSLARNLIEYAERNDIGCAVVEPQGVEHIIGDLTTALSSTKYDALIAIGGDGLVHSAVQLISGSDLPLYVLPAGTGNDFARSNKSLATSPEDIFNVLYSLSPTEIDIGEISFSGGVRKFCQILSTGFDAQVNERANLNRFVRGKMKYNFATFSEIQKFRPINYVIEIDGKSRSFEAMLVAVANGPTYGGGMKLCPMANRQDGFLDIMILHPVSKIELIKVFPKVYSGKHVNHHAVEFLKARRVKLSAETVAYADGERIGELPIEVEIVPRSLRTWAMN